MKFILLIIILFVLWLTAPMWQVEHTIDKSIVMTDKEKEEAAEQAYLSIPASERKRLESDKKYVEKFGKKPRIDHDSDTPYVVKKYWKKIYKYPENIIPLSCTPLEKSSNGWKTVCNYKTIEDSRSYQLQQHIYYIDKGTVKCARSAVKI